MRKELMNVAIVIGLGFTPAMASADEESKPETKPEVVRVEQEGYVAPHFVAYQGGRIPKDAQLTTKPDGAFIATGVSILSAAYLGSLIYAIANCRAEMVCRDGSGWLYIPIVGPFITAATAPTTGGAALAAFDGGVQVIGAGLAVAGFLWPKKFVMWQSADSSASVRIAPAGAGIGVTVTHL